MIDDDNNIIDMDSILEDADGGEDVNDIDAKIKELQAKKVRAKGGKKDKVELAKKYRAFHNAKKIYDNFSLSLHRDQQPRYFYKLLTTKQDKKNNVIRAQDIRYFSHGSLYPNFAELESQLSKTYLRMMIEGGIMSIQHPNGEYEQYKFDRRIYDKMTNTTHRVDDKTYNLVDLSEKLQPQQVGEMVCPTIIRALLYSITGNVITWNEETKDWDCNKPETLEWFEKWIYGAVHANIGDFSMSMPIIFGPGKVGKNALFDIVIRQMLGTWCCFTGTWDVIDSNFTAFKLGKTFMFVDEIPERSEWTKLKNATGSLIQYIKEKYGPEFEIDNCIVYAMGSNNHTFPLPWEDGEQMMRVSPIKTTTDSTFAGNTVRMLNKENEGLFEEPFVDALIRSTDNDPDKMTEFQKGDYILRHVMAGEWQGRDTAQQFLNYLHKKFGTSSFQLSPLRGTDWEEIKETKTNAVEVTVNFIKAHQPEVITITELYDIYKVAAGDEKFAKNKGNFLADVKHGIQNIGYMFKRSGHIANGIRDDSFIRVNADRGAMAKHKIDMDRYIKTDGVPGKPNKFLVWPLNVNDQDDHYEQVVGAMFKPVTKEDLMKKMGKR
jgi:hypothetical protein